jgi:hypothetical protein
MHCYACLPQGHASPRHAIVKHAYYTAQFADVLSLELLKLLDIL